ncbi:putative methyltransferase NSUN7 [Oncorhynchus kisutch]|uniref:putative methyltransferase NSUN7 n=1 Tax=Oncorhynchus kisutch TaxID=8019 RepID=UPI0012DE0D96|nr:putative methyltransferase NSUN7 [Oncorhynchus kisutch]
MVKKNTGHSRRSSISKTAGGSQISSLKDLSLLDGSGLGQEETPELPPEPPTPDESHLGFPDPVYLLAAVIFQNTHLEKPAAHRLVSYGKRAGLPLPEAKDEAYQRSSYELAFNTLKYQELLEDIMIDSCFYLSQPMPSHPVSSSLPPSLEEVCGVLKRGGFSQVNSVGQLEGQSFCQDPHCVDVLVFPPQLKADLYRTKLLSDNKLIIQDKWCSVGPCVVRSLLLPDGDVLMAGSSSGLTMSHTASLVTHGNAHGNSQSKVFVCVGDRPPAQREELQEVLANMACKNVKLIPMSFLSLDPCDLRLQRVRVILLTPQCSVSAVSNPVEFILQENGDTDLLQDLSQGSIAQTKLDTLVAQQKRDIIHALKFPKVQVVVYSTCSLYPEENEEVVRGALEQAGPTEGPKLQAFRPSSSLPTSLGRAEERAGCPFFRLDPSDETNGCFLAVLTREPDLEEIESAQEVLARAAATGLLDGIDSNKPTRKERRGRQTHQAPISHARSAHTRPHATASSQSRVMEFLNRETKGSSSATTVGSTNGGLSQRGKAKPARRRPPKPSLSNSTSYTSPYSTPNPASSLSRKNQTCLINTAAAHNNRHSPTATDPNPPAAPLTTAPFTPLVHPGPPKGRQEVLRPVALTLPPVLFPGYSPPARQIRNLPPPPQRSNPTLPYYQWKTSPTQVPLIKSSGSVNEKPVVKHPRPWL